MAKIRTRTTRRRSLQTLGVLSLITVALAACNQNQQAINAPPQIEAASLKPGSKGISTLQLDLSITGVSSAVGGTGFQTPAGVRASYLFQNGQVTSRMDIPGAVFPDSQDRFIVVSSKAGVNPRLYLTGSNQLDPKFNGADLAGLLSAAGAKPGSGLIDLQAPFRKLKTKCFLELAKQASFAVSNNDEREYEHDDDEHEGEHSARQVTVKQTFGNASLPTTATLYFDRSVGAVTKVDSLTTSPAGTQVASTEIKYTSLPGNSEIAVPYLVKTKVTTQLQGAAQVPPMQQPTVTRTLAPDQQPTLKPGEYIAQTFTAPSGGNGADLNRQVSEQTVRYSNIKVNTLSASFFNPGGN
jgi:hypothetical protein